eukprot:SAG22_NODE_324_length_12373_cov_23.912254_9_plen_177_part_00
MGIFDSRTLLSALPPQEIARIASGVCILTAGGLQLTVLGTKFSAPAPRAEQTPSRELVPVTVTETGKAAGKMAVSWGNGQTGEVKIPIELSPGQVFHARAPKEPQPLALPPVARGAIVGLGVGAPIVLSPFLLYGGTATARVLAPVCTMPVAALMVVVGAYYGMLEEEETRAVAPQ